MVRFLQKILKLFVNMVFLVQIALSITVFVVTVYWFMDILGWRYFDFAKPIADLASTLVGVFLPKNSAGAGLSGIELNLLYFDIIALTLVYLGDKLKVRIYLDMKRLDDRQENSRVKDESRFNDQLRKDYDNTVKDAKNIAVLIEFGLKLAYADMYYQDNLSEKLHEREEYVLNEFCKEIGKSYRCQRRANKIFIVDEYVNTDKLLADIEKVTEKFRLVLGEQKWLLDKFVSIENYDKLTREVYTALEGLLNLHLVNKIVCYPGFALRYGMEPQRMFATVIVGNYQQDVWELVKTA